MEAAGLPALVGDLRQAIADADALLIVTPEYNDGMSGVLKNALDWASRGPIRLLACKPVAVMGTSPGRNGAQGGIESVVHTLRRTRSDVLDHVIAVPFAADAFDEELTLRPSRPRRGRAAHGLARRPGLHGGGRRLTARIAGDGHGGDLTATPRIVVDSGRD